MITIVIPTFNRASVLSRCLRTVIAQSMEDWIALVIGDACTDDTAKVVAGLGDDRITFINLPKRFGEQAGPNSVGMALSETPYLAFLNHDDYWFPDHLERAVRSMETAECELYWSRAAIFRNRGAWLDRPFFNEVNEAGRRLEDVFDRYNDFCEPLSAWVMRREAAMRMGPMKLGSQTGVSPLYEYCVRAARYDLTHVSGEAITVLRDFMWYPPPSYANPAEYAESWVAQFEAGDVETVLDQIETDLWLSEALGMPRDFKRPKAGNRTVPTAAIERVTEVNLVELESVARGADNLMLGRVLGDRTGEQIEHQPDLEEAIAFARQMMS